MEKKLRLRGRDYSGMTAVVLMGAMISVYIPASFPVMPLVVLVILGLWCRGRYGPRPDVAGEPSRAATLGDLPAGIRSNFAANPDPATRSVPRPEPAPHDGAMTSAVVLTAILGIIVIIVVIALIQLASNPG
jgi:hypothetical protein